MEQRKRCPTGTWDLRAGVEASDRLVPRQRLVTGEQMVVRRGSHPTPAAIPPTPPALKPLHETLNTLAEIVGEQLVQQRTTSAALDGMAHRSLQTEQAFLRAAGFYSDQTRDTLEAVRQGNMLHDHTNQLLRQACANMQAVALRLDDMTRAIQHNSRVKQRVLEAKVPKILQRLYTDPFPLFAGAVGAMSFWVVYLGVRYFTGA